MEERRVRSRRFRSRRSRHERDPTPNEKSNDNTQHLLSELSKVVNPPGVSHKAIVDVRGNFVLMTEVVWGTLGDYFAGYKLINALRERNPRMNITWLILDAHNGVPNEKTQADKVYTFRNWDQMFGASGALTQTLRSCHGILQFPTFHFLSDVSKKMLAQTCNPKVSPLECLEYDYQSSHTDKSTVISSGLGEDSLGIFLDDFDNTAMADRLTKLPDELKKLFGSAEIDNKTYFQNHALFFGYRNKEEHRVVSKEVTIPNFIHTIAELSLLDDAIKSKDIIDIVVPILPEEEAKLDLSRLAACGFQKVLFINKEGNEREVVLDSSAKKILRIINPFRLDNADMKILIASAHPFILCTGDQSLSEVISKNNITHGFVGLPFYQTMAWKSNLFVALRMRTKQVCGVDSALDRFFRAITTIIEPIELAKLLCEPELYQDMLKLYVYIAQYKNLYSNLPQHIEQMMLRNGAVTGAALVQAVAAAAEGMAEELMDEVVTDMVRAVVFEELYGKLLGHEIDFEAWSFLEVNSVIREVFDSLIYYSDLSFEELLYSFSLDKNHSIETIIPDINEKTLLDIYKIYGYDYHEQEIQYGLTKINHFPINNTYSILSSLKINNDPYYYKSDLYNNSYHLNTHLIPFSKSFYEIFQNNPPALIKWKPEDEDSEEESDEKDKKDAERQSDSSQHCPIM